MGKRIVLCFDGTWNTPDQGAKDGHPGCPTNVFKFYESVLETGTDGVVQLRHYDDGVGTADNKGFIRDWFDKVLGGAFGLGIDQKITDGYEFLAANYEDGDEVYILGFSRGAYTARSLVGLIRNAGLLPPDKVAMTDLAYKLYRTRDDGADGKTATAFREHTGSRLIPIQFLGVWDTVGALGIPVGIAKDFNEEHYGFHDTELNWWVKNGYQALAIDEHRKTFAASLWDTKPKEEQTVEQRWFVGCHSNVGGGYPDFTLSDIALKWMQEKAMACGLHLDPLAIPPVTTANSLGTIVDSYAQFLDGAGELLGERYYRPVCVLPYSRENLHASVPVRAEDATAVYTPPNIGYRKALVELEAAKSPVDA